MTQYEYYLGADLYKQYLKVYIRVDKSKRFYNRQVYIPQYNIWKTVMAPTSIRNLKPCSEQDFSNYLVLRELSK